MENRPAKTADLNEIMQIVSQAQAFMKAQGLDQWQDGYPRREDFEKDIENGQCYLLLSEGEAAAIVTVTTSPEPCYEDIHNGSWLTDGESYAVIHRSAVNEKYRGKGIGKGIISFSENLARKSGAKSLRVDTHRDNKPMRGLLESQGFKYCGTVYLQGRDYPRFYREAYEKLL